MEVWEIVEFVRKQKGITIAELCGEEASRSVYKRFIQNKADTTVSKLTYFLKKLNLDYDELQLFNFPNDLSEVNRLMQEAVVAFEKKDSLELHSIIMLYETEEPDSQRERHLISLCRLMIAQLKEEKINVLSSEVYQYLMKAQTWTRYEIFLFTNCMYAFHPKFIDLILEKSFLSLAVYEENRSGQSETFRMLANGLILFIKNQDLRLVWKYGAKLEEYFLEEELYYERNLQLFLQGVWCVIKGNKKGKYHIKNALAVSCYLDSKQQYQKKYELLRFVEQAYHVDFELKNEFPPASN